MNESYDYVNPGDCQRLDGMLYDSVGRYQGVWQREAYSRDAIGFTLRIKPHLLGALNGYEVQRLRR